VTPGCLDIGALIGYLGGAIELSLCVLSVAFCYFSHLFALIGFQWNSDK